MTDEESRKGIEERLNLIKEAKKSCNKIIDDLTYYCYKCNEDRIYCFSCPLSLTVKKITLIFPDEEITNNETHY